MVYYVLQVQADNCSRSFFSRRAAQLVETPALPGSCITSSARVVAGAECSPLPPHPFPFSAPFVTAPCPVRVSCL